MGSSGLCVNSPFQIPPQLDDGSASHPRVLAASAAAAGLGDMLTNMMKDPKAMEKIMENPMVQGLMKDPSKLGNIMNNPMVQGLMKDPSKLKAMMDHPMVNQVKKMASDNPEMASQMAEMLTKPDGIKTAMDMMKGMGLNADSLKEDL